jgi:DNA-binding SARP family transcriptional activator
MAGGIQLMLLTGFQLACDGNPVSLPMSAQRLVAFMGLQDRPVQRNYVAGALWLDTPDDRAAASLRSALWRARQPGLCLVEAGTGGLRLSRDVTVDIKEATRFAHRVGDPNVQWSDADPQLDALSGDLLPDWYEDWVLVERERFHQIRLHALETICVRLTEQSRFAEAIEAGMAAVCAEPLRESANRCLIKAHLAEGNRIEARRQYERFRQLLYKELNESPSPELEGLVHGGDIQRFAHTEVPALLGVGR